MTFRTIINFLLLTLVLTDIRCEETRPECYGTDVFYDTVTKTCSQCSDICDNADIQGTEKYCSQECPGYTSSRKSSTTVPTAYDEPGSETWLAFVVVLVFLIVSIIVLYCCRKHLLNVQHQAHNATWLCRVLYWIKAKLSLSIVGVDNDADNDANRADDVPLGGIQAEQEPHGETSRKCLVGQPNDDESGVVLLPS